MKCLWMGPGDLFADLPAVLEALSRRPDGASAGSIRALEDLDLLLDPPPHGGLLLLDADGLPAEDIGLVRRFLRRYRGWNLVLCGQDPRHHTVRALSVESRIRWLSWPPDLDQLRQLARYESPEPGNGSIQNVAAAPAAVPSAWTVDLGELVEERLATAALAGDDAPRFTYHSSGDLQLAHAAEDLSRLVDSLLSVAGGCTKDGSVVSVRAETAAPPADGATLSVEFPSGPLSGLEKLDLAELPSALGEEEGRAGATAVRLAGHLGGRARLEPTQDGSVRVQVALPRQGQPARAN